MLPTIPLGDHEVSRLIVGGNPISGNSHVSQQLDDEMQDYFSTDNVKRLLHRCLECGINTMQLRADKHILRILREFRLDGGQMNWVAQTAPEIGSFEGNIRQITSYHPIAIYHHGTVTDALYKQGQIDEIRRRLAVIRETGCPVGLGTHMPEVIERADHENWGVDFYMASVHNLSKIVRVSSAVTGVANQEEPFDDEDRTIMYRTIRATQKPCLAFKILSATRRCQSPDSVRAAFEEAFSNIKSTDAVVVGMFPRDRDQVSENANYVRSVLGTQIAEPQRSAQT